MSDRDDDARLTPPPVALAIAAIGRQGAALLFALALVLAPASIALAAPVSGTEPVVSEPPRVLDTLPREAYEPHLEERAVEWETWDYAFWFPDGHRLLAQFRVTSAGPGRHHGVVVGIVVRPDRTTTLIRNSRPRGEWRFETRGDEVRLSLHRHDFVIGHERHRLRLQNRKGRFEIEAEATTPSVVLGPVRYARDERFELTLLAPRLRCRGVLQLTGEPALTLRDGWGIASHALSTLPDHRQALSALALHTFDAPEQVSALAFAAPHGRGQESFGWLLVSRVGRPLEVVSHFERHWGGAVREAEPPNYLWPRSVQLASAGGPTVQATISLLPIARFDLLSWIENALVRFVAGRVSHPVQYLFDADYTLRIGAEGQTPPRAGRGLALLSILNQPRAQWP